MLDNLAVAEISGEYVEVLVVRSGDEGDALAVGRKARLEIYGAFSSELMGFFFLEVERPEFQRVVGVGSVDDPAAVGRTVGLVIVAGALRELVGFGEPRF